MTVCALEKIDACPLEGFIPEKVDELLNLKDRKFKICFIISCWI